MASTPHCQSIYVFSLTSQARFPTQGTRRTAHSKKPLQHKSCRRCLYKRGSLFAHIASSRGLCQNIGLLRRGINAVDCSDFAMESFESVSADQKQHIMDLPASWSLIGISKKWRVCPLVVSMWLCLFSRASVSEEARNKAVATPRCFVMALPEAKKQFPLGTLASPSVHTFQQSWWSSEGCHFNTLHSAPCRTFCVCRAAE